MTKLTTEVSEGEKYSRIESTDHEIRLEVGKKIDETGNHFEKTLSKHTDELLQTLKQNSKEDRIFNATVMGVVAAVVVGLLGFVF
ncbi:hypothetical protein J2S74_002319 [Evansella vedderi]|uniref:TMhelix containing protein n=1 Tax=Evansella vedderi TaxID=38282 RepID=A0ABT9ZW15_9BACI|nr:hypothetical protein [Evansella vedderi]MDQ0254937.1 hypothetical protein [Evansella vedderi]